MKKNAQIATRRERVRRRARSYKKSNLCARQCPLKKFFDGYYSKQLKLFKRHMFLLILLSKNHVGKDRKDTNHHEVWTSRDFAERLQLKFNSQVQSEYFGQGVSLSLEGVAVMHKDDKDDQQMQFHTFLSSNPQQDSAVVHQHSMKLFQHLKDNQLIKAGSTVLCNTDGCAAQYRCGTAFHFLSALACQFDVHISRAICCPGHG